MKAKITKEQIIAELKRIALNNDGQPPGLRTFEIESGFSRSSWRGVYWSKWSDVQDEAGFTPNQASQRIEDYQIYEMLVPLCRSINKLPTLADMMLWRRRENPNFPVQVIQGRIGMDQLKVGFLSWLSTQSETYPDLIQLFDGQTPNELETEQSTDENESAVDGYVYLMKSGDHYKIGKSKDLDRRHREIRTQMPETVDYTHFIKTDDMAGIERYWHRRFEKQRVNGEWFKLTRLDISAFKKRKFQ